MVSTIIVLAYVSDAWVLATYALMAAGRRSLWFHMANALGAVPIAAVEIAARTWPPLILTVAFGLIGAVGMVLYNEEKA